MGDENRLFRQFEANLRMTPATVSAVRNRYHAITRRINVDFWGTSSDTDHSWYAGSYGRGTAISTSDIDILVELPPGEYNNAWARSLFGGNGPSELLQKVKRSLSATYPQTKLRGDGQGVGHRQRPERLPARAGPPRRGRGSDQAPGHCLHAHPGASGLSPQAGDPRQRLTSARSAWLF